MNFIRAWWYVRAISFSSICVGTALCMTPLGYGKRFVNLINLASGTIVIISDKQHNLLRVYEGQFSLANQKRAEVFVRTMLPTPTEQYKIDLQENEKKMLKDVAMLQLRQGKLPVSIIQDDWGMPLDKGLPLWEEVVGDGYRLY